MRNKCDIYKNIETYFVKKAYKTTKVIKNYSFMTSIYKNTNDFYFLSSVFLK